MYDEVLRVPLLVRYPAAVPARIDAPVELFDLFATIAELAGLPLPAGTHSESLAGKIGQRLQADQAVISGKIGDCVQWLIL